MGEGRVAPPLEVFSKNNFIYLFILAVLVFVALRAASGGVWELLCCHVWASHCAGFSWGAQAWKQAGFSSHGSWALEYRPSSCGVWAYLSSACGIFLIQGSILCLLHWRKILYP